MPQYVGRYLNLLVRREMGIRLSGDALEGGKGLLAVEGFSRVGGKEQPWLLSVCSQPRREQLTVVLLRRDEFLYVPILC
jgi:hypothetical protein